jgi:hypothetical protein
MTAPSVGERKPATILSKVVLPQPDGPSTVMISPGFIFMETFFRA